MNAELETYILSKTGGKSITQTTHLQSLWSGYGSIIRCELAGGKYPSVIVKQIRPPKKSSHPRGWDTDISHQRKLKSYRVEKSWYLHYAKDCSKDCRIPHLLGLHESENEPILLLEDLDASGFPRRIQRINDQEFETCIRWLAYFHAHFFKNAKTGLWSTGNYWHLDTRPDELSVLESEDPELYTIAPILDQRLKNSSFQTLIHGDAKLANFCFSRDGMSVAAVDFKYVGGGCGVQDLAYFAGSCLDQNQCSDRETRILDIYFRFLREAIVSEFVDFDALESEWRALYPIAWADFHRFLKGWSPGHWKINTYSETVTRKVIQSINRNAQP